MKMDFMKIVKEICSIESANCRSLNKSEVARKLMDMIDIPRSAEIQEIPLDWNDQVEILFTIPEDKYYYGLSAGHGIRLQMEAEVKRELTEEEWIEEVKSWFDDVVVRMQDCSMTMRDAYLDILR